MTKLDKKELQRLLAELSTTELLEALRNSKKEALINALLHFFYHKDEEIRVKAIYVFGKVVEEISKENLEKARIIFRRLMWSLNEESGGIGWGAPEAMAEIMFNSPTLAEEYFHILLSYIREDGNLLEFTPLRIGAFVGLTRLIHKYPHLFQRLNALEHVKPYLKSPNETERKLAQIIYLFLNDISIKASFEPMQSA